MTDSFDAPAMPVPRDGWKRPLIVPPGGGKPKAYTRVTSYIDVLDDKYRLNAWKQRMVALGLADRPDLLLSVAAYRDDKEALNRICKQASEAARASAGATTGTALHALTEQMDRGQKLGIVPAEAAADLAAYRQATAGIKHLAIEQFCVCDEYRTGGTPDRASYVECEGECVIADLKTGANEIEYGGLKIAMQLALYAHSVPYDPATGRQEWGFDISRERALVISLPAGSGRCELHWVDIVAGWEAVQTASRVRYWRSRRDWYTPYVPPQPPTPAAVMQPATGFDIMGKIVCASTVDELRRVWTDAVAAGTWTDAHLTAALERKAQLDHKVAS